MFAIISCLPSIAILPQNGFRRGFKDVLTIDAANHNMIDSCGTLVSCCAWHSK